MSYPSLTEEQELMRNAARDFAQTEGMAAYMAQVQAGKYPMDFGYGLWPRLAELNFIGIATPEKMGGLGMDVTTQLLVMEELSVIPAVGTNIDAHDLALHTIEFNGSEYQKEKYGIPAAKGQIICAAAVTDPAGSMNFPEWSITVEETKGGYILNGTKLFCSSSIAADLYAVYTKDYENGYPMGCFLVEKDTEGLQYGHLEEFGKTGTNTGTVVLKNVFVPKENKIPSGDLANAAWLGLGYLDCSAVLIAWAQGALTKTIDYVKTRTRNGKPLASLQAVAHRIANMDMQLEQARLVMYTAAAYWDAGKPNPKLNSMAKITSSEALTKISHDCCVLHGAYGMAPETGLIQIHTAAPSGHVGECPNDFHRDLIARELGIALDSHLA